MKGKNIHTNLYIFYTALETQLTKSFRTSATGKCGNLKKMPCFSVTGFSVESNYLEFFVLRSLFFIRQAAAVIQKLIVGMCLADTTNTAIVPQLLMPLTI